MRYLQISRSPASLPSSSLLQDLLHNLGRGGDNEPMLDGMHACLEVRERLARLVLDLLDEDGLATVHLLDHVMNHDSRPVRPAGLEVCLGAPDGVCAVVLACSEVSADCALLGWGTVNGAVRHGAGVYPVTQDED